MGSGLAIIYFYVTFETEDIVHQGCFLATDIPEPGKYRM